MVKYNLLTYYTVGLNIVERKGDCLRVDNW